MDSHQRHLARGFNWLGGAAVIAKVTDFVAILVVLLFLTKEQVGIAALVVSIGMVIEALDGLGTSDALVQAPTLSRLQLDTLFWFVIGSAVIVACATLLVAQGVQHLYGVAGIAGYFIAVAVKQPLVAAAVVPLSLMSRHLQYERIAIVNVGATFGAALTRLLLAVLGFGVWSLVAAYAVSGIFILVGASLARPYIPRLRFQFSAIRPLLHFGLRASASNVFDQVFKNVDYLLVGWFYGAASLAIYRVAFDLAMEPAMAVSTLINRTALPVFARVAGAPAQMAQSLLWAIRRLVMLVAPLIAGLVLVALPLTSLLHDEGGSSYVAAAWPLRLLAMAALLRVLAQLLFPVMMATGHPGQAARLSGATLALLSLGILIAGFVVPQQYGIIAVAALWFGLYPLVLVWAAIYLRRHWGICTAELLRSCVAPAVALGAVVALVLMADRFTAGGPAWLQLGIGIAATAAAYAGLFLYSRRRDQAARVSGGAVGPA